MENIKIAAIQMNSYADLSYNIKLAEDLIAKAADRGAKFVLLSEYFYWMGGSQSKRYAFAETFGHGSLQCQLSE
ncbi:MAG: hypothetical protein CENE_01879 [Candidatus Celerinatantimonas neptuna]|nr:MAG: hypothetical protein CENE_01879 [Candidatus Celerinatantimonas neptuna]